MMSPEVYRERSPLSEKDCFVVFDRRKSTFTFPVHIHPEYELNFVQGAKGAKRIVGDHEETIADKDLVLIANPKLKHAWKDGDCKNKNIHEITIQFHPQLIEQYKNKNQFSSIGLLFERASKGIAFGTATIEKVQPLLQILTMETEGFYSVMRLFILLYELSKSEDYRQLSSGTNIETNRTTALLNRLHEHISTNISKDIRISDTAKELNMSRSTFARFLAANTEMNFTDYVLNHRIKTAVLKLKAGLPIAEVADQCGFNSVSYFYRVFKKAEGINPAEYRDNHQKQRLII